MASEKYSVIVSDRAKRMLGAHIRFMANVDKKAADNTKKRLLTALRSLEKMPHNAIRFLKNNTFRQINIIKCLSKNGI